MIELNDLHILERGYARLYSQEEKTPYGMRYTDLSLPDMYCHNFLRIDTEALGLFEQAARYEQTYRKRIGCPMVQIEYFGPSRPECMEKLDPEMLKTQLLMSVELEQIQKKNVTKACSVIVASTPEQAAEGRRIDQIAFGSEYADFAGRRFDRKRRVYEDASCGMEHLLVYADGHYVGNCDLFVSGLSAKIEDVDILPEFQGRGYGRALLQDVADRAAKRGARFLALQVDEENDVARSLYSSLGFRVYDKNHMYTFPLEG